MLLSDMSLKVIQTLEALFSITQVIVDLKFLLENPARPPLPEKCGELSNHLLRLYNSLCKATLVSGCYIK